MINPVFSRKIELEGGIRPAFIRQISVVAVYRQKGRDYDTGALGLY